MVHVGLAAIVLVAAGLHVWWLHDLVANRVMRWWFLALGLFTVAVAARRWLWLPLRARHRSYVVEEVRPTAGAAVTVTVRAHEHEGLPFRAGQFAWLKIGASPFVFEEHPFTIASTAERPHRKEFTIKALGDFSELIAGLRPGRRVYLDGPYGGFTPNVRRGPGLVLIAGGVGITPMLSILRTFADRRDRRHHRLIVGARSVDDLVRRNELDELSSRLWLTVTEVVQQAPPGFQGETGRIDLPLLDRLLPPRRRRHHDYYLCGPPAMVAAVGHELRDLGVPTRRIHTEQFEVV